MADNTKCEHAVLCSKCGQYIEVKSSAPQSKDEKETKDEKK